MRFSIVVPVYNVRDYLAECLDSIKHQNYQDYEVIIIDDGSTDGGSDICDQYNKYDNFSVYHQENMGLSKTRNRGIELARGEYIIFIDSDDIILQDSLKNLNSLLLATNNPDVLITEMYDTPDVKGNVPSILFDIPEWAKKEWFKFTFTKKKHIQAAQQYIVKRKMLINNDIKFEVGYYHEDNVYTPFMLANAKTAVIYNRAWYIRRINRLGSITNSVNPKRVADIIELTNMYINSQKFNNLSEYERKIAFQSMLDSLWFNLSYYPQYDKKSQEAITIMISNNIDLFKYANRTRQRLFRAMLRVLGVSTTLSLIKFYKRSVG